MRDSTASDTRYRYAERAPSASLASWIVSLWSVRVVARPLSGETYTVFPDGCTSVAIVRSPAAPPMLVCRGPSLTAARPRVSLGTEYVGFRLWPDVTEVVTGMPARALRDFVGLAPHAVAERFAGLERVVSDSLTDHDAASP